MGRRNKTNGSDNNLIKCVNKIGNELKKIKVHSARYLRNKRHRLMEKENGCRIQKCIYGLGGNISNNN